MTGNTATDIRFQSGANGWTVSNAIPLNGTSCAHLNSVSGVTIQNSIFQNCDDAFHSAGIDSTGGVTDLTIRQNQIQDNETGVYDAGSQNTLIEDNTITNNIYGVTTTGIEGSTVRGNQINNNDIWGVSLTGSNHIIEDNTFQNNSYVTNPDIDLDSDLVLAGFIFESSDNIIRYNNFLGGPGTAIGVRALYFDQDNSISLNTISNYRYGIAVTTAINTLGSPEGSIDGSTLIKENVISSTSIAGIYMRAGDANYNITGNGLVGNAIGISTINSTGLLINYNNFNLNTTHLRAQSNNPESILDVTNNYWNLPNAQGVQDCASIDAKILDKEDLSEGQFVNFNPILEGPYPTGLSKDKCTPILMVHGIYSNDAMWDEGTAQKLTTEGMRFYRVGQENGKTGLKPNNGPINSLAGQVSTAISSVKLKTGERKVDVLAHSMGGLATRAYSQSPIYAQRLDIRKFIMLGTPNEGSPIADKNGFISVLLGLFGDSFVDQARLDMIPNSPFLNALNSGPNPIGINYKLIAGNQLPTNWFKKMLICKNQKNYCPPFQPLLVSDSIVPVSSVDHFGQTTCFETPVTHSTMLGVGYTNHLLTIVATTSLLQGEAPALNTCVQQLLTLEDVHVEVSTYNMNINPNQVQTVTSFMPNAAFITALNSLATADVLTGLVDPNGNDINKDTYLQYTNVTRETSLLDGNEMEVFIVQNPIPGLWQVKVSGKMITQPTVYELTLLRDTDVTLKMSTDKAQYGLSTPIIITGKVNSTLGPDTNSNVQALITNNGNTAIVPMFDDGLHGDGNIMDGTYGAIYSSAITSGLYEITVTANGISPLGLYILEDRDTVSVGSPVDLAYSGDDISLSIPHHAPGSVITMDVNVSNLGEANAQDANFLFSVKDSNNVIVNTGSVTYTIPGKESQTVSLPWTLPYGTYTITVTTAPFNPFMDTNFSNEGGSKIIKTCPMPAVVGGPSTPTACAGRVNNINNFP